MVLNNQISCRVIQQQATQMKYLELLIGVWIRRSPVRMHLISELFSPLWNPAEFLIELHSTFHIKHPEHWMVQLLVRVWDETSENQAQVGSIVDVPNAHVSPSILPAAFVSSSLVHRSRKWCWRLTVCERSDVFTLQKRHQVPSQSCDEERIVNHLTVPILTFTRNNVCRTLLSVQKFQMSVQPPLFLSGSVCVIVLKRVCLFISQPPESSKMLPDANRKQFALCSNSSHRRINVP